MNANGSNSAVILSAVRTPIGRLRSALASVAAAELGATVVRAAVKKAALPDLAEIDEVLMGNVVSAGLGQNIARQAAIVGGLPATVGATTLNKVCGSSLKAVMLAAQAIRAGDGQLFVAGGVEQMSQAPHLRNGPMDPLHGGKVEHRNALLVDGLWCPFEDWVMGEAAEFIAEEYGITREAMDRFALSSHQKAIAAIDGNKFKEEIVPVRVKGLNAEIHVLDTDEGPRRDTSLEALQKLKPSFKPDGKITAGNAPGLNDAAAALVVASRSQAEAMGAKVLARIVAYAQAAVDPKYIFSAPAKAIPLLLEKTGWTLSDIDLVELNEAFAAQILANGQELSDIGWDWNKVNVNGGAIALGHPLGATGARLLTTLIHALKDRGLKRGIASLCLGGGEAVALAVETEEPL
ncbi:MAG: thiolase family protein [Acidobacteria bacterium]|nr:thiolase family protein [Acidobacteriota bacterium]